MREPFPEHYKEIADSMGIALYQRFDLNEASLFLRCPVRDVTKLLTGGKLAGIQVTENEFQVFGYQLLEYLLENVTRQPKQSQHSNDHPERIMRAKEAVAMTGLSRTTIWRMEKSGQFPNRVSLGVGSVGWRESEISTWINRRQDLKRPFLNQK